MSLINSTAIPSGVADDYEIGHSLRFNPASSPYLSREFVTPTNRKIWTLSLWFKRGNLSGSSERRLFSTATGAGGNTDNINYTTGDSIRFIADFGQLICTQVFRDPSSWYHLIYAYDSTQGTEANRLKLYINGTQVTSFSTTAYPSLNQEVDFNSAVVHDIGRNLPESAQYYDGYMSEVYFIDGAAKAPADFGTTGTYGEWKPIEYSAGSYGNNGFYLNFATANDMGDDKSGNGHDFSENNIAATDQMLDSPTNNFATLNPLWQDSSITLQEGNLRSSRNANMNRPSLSTINMGTGKWYFEALDQYTSGNQIGVQWEGTNVETYVHDSGTQAYTFSSSGGTYGNGSSGAGNSGGSVTVGARIRMIAYDGATGKLWGGANGTWGSSGNPAAGSNECMTVPAAYRDKMHFIVATENSTTSQGIIANFGQDSSFAGNKTAQGNQDGNDIGDFYYTPPSGFLALCTSNLPDVAVIPSEHFNILAYDDGAGAKVVGLQPDLVWFKGRGAGYDHKLVDSVRGVQKKLQSNDNTVEGTDSTGLTSFNSNGFTVGSNASYSSQVGAGIVAWNWKAGNATLGTGDFTQGNIASTCSRNVDAGFSIVSYEGTGAVATVGHGLSSAPEFITVKNRESGKEWMTYTYTTSNTDRLLLNTTGATAADSGAWNNTSPSASLFTIGSGVQTNADNNDYIAYCFHSVEGYSKVGSAYTGNGNVDGTFVYLGFRPRYFMLKRTDSADAWVIFDSAREPENEDDGQDLSLLANSGNPEAAYGNIDFLSNGVKIRIATGYMNNNSSPYIYMAFAETPFKYSNAR